MKDPKTEENDMLMGYFFANNQANMVRRDALLDEISLSCNDLI